MKLKGIDHIVLRVRDLETMVRFYCDVLGMAVERRQDRIGLVQLRAGASLIDLVDIASEEGAWGRPEVAGGRNMDHFCLATGPWDEAALRAHLAAHGVEIVEEGIRSGARGEGLSFYVRDPAGNTIELKGPPATSGGGPRSLRKGEDDGHRTPAA